MAGPPQDEHGGPPPGDREPQDIPGPQRSYQYWQPTVPAQYPQPAPGQWAPPTGYWAPPGAAPGSPPRGYWSPNSGWTPPPLPKAGTGKTGALPLHPMTMGDILDASFKLLRANFVTIAGVICLLVVPLQLIAAIAERNFLGGNSVVNVFNNAANGFQTQTQTSDTSSIASSISSLISLLVLPFAAGAISKLVAGSYLGEEIGVREALGSALRRWWALLLAWILVHLLEGVATIALILPGLLVMSLCVAVSPAIVLERLGPIRGIRRSWRLDRRRMWGILGICLMTGLIFSITASIVVVPLEAAAFAMGLHWGWILLFVAGVVSSLVSIPLNAIVATLVYFDGRIRNEGFDLQAMSHRLNS
jgi:hypothetical protein